MHQSFKEIQEQYIFWLDTLGFSKHSIRKYGSKGKELFEWLTAQNINHIDQLRQSDIKAFFNYQETRKNKKSTTPLSTVYLNDYYIGVDKLLEFLHQIGAKNTPTPTNYRITVDKDERVRKIEPFTIGEIKILQTRIAELYPNYDYKHREQKHYQLKLVFALHYGCGLRLNEGYKLTAKDIDFNKRTVFVHQGKNYKDRIVPINDNVYNALQDYIYNFRNLVKCNHNRLYIHGKVALLRSLKDLHRSCKNKNVQNKRLGFHILRHSIATHLLQKGMPIENIARFLGHNSLTSTQIYTHIINR